MDKYPYLFDNVSGKVVNIFSNKDDDLFKYKIDGNDVKKLQRKMSDSGILTVLIEEKIELSLYLSSHLTFLC